jgi:hypothetical protein
VTRGRLAVPVSRPPSPVRAFHRPPNCANFSAMAKSKKAIRRSGGAKSKAGAASPDPLVQRTLDAVREKAQLEGVSPIQYVRGVLTGRYARLTPRDLGE